MSLLHSLSDVVGDVFEGMDLNRSFGQVSTSDRPDLCQFQCNGALAAAKELGQSPVAVAERVVLALESDERFAKIGVAGPGFINLTLTDAELADRLAGVVADPSRGVTAPTAVEKVVLDYGGPNVAKDLHVGHLRPALIGESLKRLYLLAGHEVVSDVHLGDWGLPMGQLLAAFEEAHPDWPYFASPSGESPRYPERSPVTIDDLHRLYPVAAARSGEDPDFLAQARAATVALQDGHAGYRALWQHARGVSVDALRSVYNDLDVRFDLWFGESSVAEDLDPMIAGLVDSGIATESDGALVIDVSQPDDKTAIPPLILRNSLGGFTYAATDLATISHRAQHLAATAIVYVVDNRQSLHFVQLFRAARLAGVAPEDVALFHASNGTVNGPDGRPFKTRSGGLPTLRDLLSDVERLAMQRLVENDLAGDGGPAERAEVARVVGLGALKFAELANHRSTDYSFDIERFTLLTGRTGPYLQYVAVRANAVLDRAASAGLTPGDFIEPSHEAERALGLAILSWPDVVARALEGHSPNTIADFAYELAGCFNRFYDACHILSEPDRSRGQSWLATVRLTAEVLRSALDVLGVQIPDRM